MAMIDTSFQNINRFVNWGHAQLQNSTPGALLLRIGAFWLKAENFLSRNSLCFLGGHFSWQTFKIIHFMTSAGVLTDCIINASPIRPLFRGSKERLDFTETLTNHAIAWPLSFQVYSLANKVLDKMHSKPLSYEVIHALPLRWVLLNVAVYALVHRFLEQYLIPLVTGVVHITFNSKTFAQSLRPMLLITTLIHSILQRSPVSALPALGLAWTMYTNQDDEAPEL